MDAEENQIIDNNVSTFNEEETMLFKRICAQIFDESFIETLVLTRMTQNCFGWEI